MKVWGFACLYLLNYLRYESSRNILHQCQNCSKTSLKYEKKDVVKIISSAFLLEFLTLYTTQLYRIPLIDVAWVFHWFCAWVFVLCLALKGESSLIFEIFVPDIWVEYMLQFWENEFQENLSKIINQNGSVLMLLILELNGRSTSFTKMKIKTCLH